ncbi:MAG: ATP-binding protein [Sphingobacterium thalpophilum]|jgi:DNA polymerase-3 subunit delta'
MLFQEVIGQNAIKEQLIQSVFENRVSHAQLFLGPEGSGSFALALAYAQFISCTEKTETDSCGNCASCRKYNKLIHPDLHFSYPFFRGGEKEDSMPDLGEWRDLVLSNPYFNLDEWRLRLDAENKQPNINKAECLNILNRLSLKAFESEYKTMIIWLPEYLKNEGNRLLKTLEEPANKTLIILVAQNQDQILNTIISRTQLVKIPALKNDDISRYLIDNKDVPETQASRIAYLSNGSLQAALNHLKEDDHDDFRNFSGWMRMTFADKGAQIIDFVDVLSKLGRENQKNMLRYGVQLIRECIMMISGAESLVHLPSLELDFVKNFSRQLDLAKCEALINELEKAHYHIERNANPKILFLDVSLHFVKILKFNTLPAGTQYILN